jgi:hypothetical protein
MLSKLCFSRSSRATPDGWQAARDRLKQNARGRVAGADLAAYGMNNERPPTRSAVRLTCVMSVRHNIVVLQVLMPESIATNVTAHGSLTPISWGLICFIWAYNLVLW